MCGIVGFWGEIAQTPDALARLERMTASLSHRGPDGQSSWVGTDVGLVQSHATFCAMGSSSSQS